MATKSKSMNGPAIAAAPSVNKAAAAEVAAEAVVEDIRHIEIPVLEVRSATLHLVGITPLIVHRWSEKALKKLEDAQTGRAKQKDGPRIPAEEWKSAAYIVPGKENAPDWKPGKYCFPATAFKHAFLYGVAQLGDTKRMPKTQATGWLFLEQGNDPVLDFSEVVLRTDVGRNPTQPIYRPQFNDWSVELEIGYDANAITLEQVVTLMDHGGFKGGIGEWRPSAPKNKSGSYGRFRVGGVNG